MRLFRLPLGRRVLELNVSSATPYKNGPIVVLSACALEDSGFGRAFEFRAVLFGPTVSLFLSDRTFLGVS